MILFKNKVTVSLILSFLFFNSIIFSQNSFAQLTEQNSRTYNRLHSIFFIDGNYGWVGGRDVIANTINGGVKWVHQKTPENIQNNDYVEIYFINNSIGFAATIYNSNINLKTVDGGENWSIFDLNNLGIHSISFANDSVGWLTASDALVNNVEPDEVFIYKTTDIGKTWNRILYNTTAFTWGPKNLVFVDENVGWASDRRIIFSSNLDGVFKTIDAGESWIKMGTVTHGINTLEYIIGDTIWVANGLSVSFDQGVNWKSTDHGYLQIFDIHQVTGKIGWAIAGDGSKPFELKLLYTEDAFDTYETIDLEGIFLYRLTGIGKNKIWAIGELGEIVLYNRDFTTGVFENIISPSSFQLSQNYPNPFNPSTKIEFSLDKSEKISIKIYNIQGKEVRSLASSKYAIGNYKLIWDGKNNLGVKVSSGIYFYKMTSKTHSITKKMLLIK